MKAHQTAGNQLSAHGDASDPSERPDAGNARSAASARSRKSVDKAERPEGSIKPLDRQGKSTAIAAKDASNNAFTITLRPEPAGIDAYGRDPAYRLKIGLKRLLRDCGLRAVGVATIPATLGDDSTMGNAITPPAPPTRLGATGGNANASTAGEPKP